MGRRSLQFSSQMEGIVTIMESTGVTNIDFSVGKRRIPQNRAPFPQFPFNGVHPGEHSRYAGGDPLHSTAETDISLSEAQSLVCACKFAEIVAASNSKFRYRLVPGTDLGRTTRYCGSRKFGPPQFPRDCACGSRRREIQRLAGED